MMTEVITSRQNATVGYACKLSEKKYRDAEKKFRFDGFKLLEEALMSGVSVDTILVNQKSVDRFNEFSQRISLKSIRPFDVKIVSENVFEKITEEKSPEGVICIAKHLDNLHKNVKINRGTNSLGDFGIKNDETLFAVESVRDPGNIGTIIRTAAAFGVNHIVISSDCADIYNSRTVRAAMGALFRLSIIRVDNMGEFLMCLAETGRQAYAATLKSDSLLLGKHTLDSKDCIVVGNEGHGLSQNTINACGSSILIPMAPNSESLNAAVAASVCMWEQFGKYL